uniref:TSA: Wollemia nobilis Ref_Wollemi_Transcript_11629_915 transcribed RNA sequence n=1 Tax=Wollemia nobilis TaxID=56998 RepID=A0A0C9RM00_9CONI
MATRAAAKTLGRSLIPRVREHLPGYVRARTLSTTVVKNFSPEDDSLEQDERQGRRAFENRRNEFADIFNDPFYPLRGLGLRVDGLFNSNPFAAVSRGSGELRKPWDAVEDKDALRLRVDMPGLGKEDVKVYAEENSLVIKGEAQSDAELDGSGRKYSSRIDLPPKVYKLDQIKAQMKNGVLKVEVPKFKEEEIKNVINVSID